MNEKKETHTLYTDWCRFILRIIYQQEHDHKFSSFFSLCFSLFFVYVYIEMTAPTETNNNLNSAMTFTNVKLASTEFTRIHRRESGACYLTHTLDYECMHFKHWFANFSKLNENMTEIILNRLLGSPKFSECYWCK